MQVVYEIIQDDMPLDLPLFTDLERAKHELNQLLQHAWQEADSFYRDAFIMPANVQEQEKHVVEAHYVMAFQGQLEYVSFGLFRRDINTGTMGESRS